MNDPLALFLCGLLTSWLIISLHDFWRALIRSQKRKGWFRRDT